MQECLIFDMCKISILVPVYGVEDYIERCSRSLFEQTYLDMEFVFVDDFTPDKSLDILKYVMKDYPEREHCVKIISHDRNKGLAAARNTCLDNASGEFVCFVDSDDWLEKDAIQTLVKKQVETKADLVFGSRCEHRSDGVVEIRYPNVEKSQRVALNLDGDYMPLTGAIIRLSLFEEHAIRCIEGFNMAEDVRLICLLSYFADIMLSCDNLTYHYDKNNPNSVMHEAQDKNKVLKNTYKNLQNKLSILDFFSDKEKQFYEKAVEMTVRQLKIVLKQALKRRNKQTFYDIVSIIDAHPDIVEAIQWKRSGLNGFWCRNFALSEIVFQVNRIIKIKK